MRNLLLMLLLLVGVAGAAVVPDGSQLPPSDPDAPTVTLPGPAGGPPVKVPAVGPASSRTTGGETRLGSSTNPLGSSGGGSGGKGGKAGGKPTGSQTVTPSPAVAEVPRFTLPNGQPVPWSLIALAVLLFMFAVGGGVYFYQSRDE